MNSEIVKLELNLPPPPPTPPAVQSPQSPPPIITTSPPELNSSKLVESILKRSTYRKSTNIDENASDNSLSSSSTHANCISTNHYERLVEELKCPGCATPMKAPIRLCSTGHSICDKCTNTLACCPLCKELFTNIRSLTLEAIASKALFRCQNAPGGCPVRLQTDLLLWHEKQCAHKTMKCFMGRVWGECNWVGREVLWKEHLDSAHPEKKINKAVADLQWTMTEPKKSIAGYYVFEVYDEMFNFYQVNDKGRILFTMACTSTTRDKKFNFSYDVEIFCPEDDTYVIRQRFPCHSEYDKDILQEGTCVCISLVDIARFVNSQKILNFRVMINKVKKRPRSLAIEGRPTNGLPLDFKSTQIEGVNLKNVPSENILTRKLEELEEEINNEKPPPAEEEKSPNGTNSGSAKQSSISSDIEDDPELEAFIKARWGTPQLNFNRKYLIKENVANGTESSSSSQVDPSLTRDEEYMLAMSKRYEGVGKDGKMSVRSVKKSIRKSIKSLKNEFLEMTSKRPSPATPPSSPNSIEIKELPKTPVKH